MEEQHLFMKVIVWRILSVSITLAVTWGVTGDLSEATGLTLILHLVLVISHYLFEKGWMHWVSRYAKKNDTTNE